MKKLSLYFLFAIFLALPLWAQNQIDTRQLKAPASTPTGSVLTVVTTGGKVEPRAITMGSGSGFPLTADGDLNGYNLFGGASVQATTGSFMQLDLGGVTDALIPHDPVPWTATNYYLRGRLVELGPAVYLCISNVPLNGGGGTIPVPGTPGDPHTNHWSCLVSNGAPGTVGSTGPQGPAGLDGVGNINYAKQWDPVAGYSTVTPVWVSCVDQIYEAILSSTNVYPPLNTGTWRVVVAKGLSGTLTGTNFAYMGSYDATLVYVTNHVVNWGGNLFVVVTNAGASGFAPSLDGGGQGINNAYWHCIVKRGDPGSSGPPGAQGPPGQDSVLSNIVQYTIYLGTNQIEEEGYIQWTNNPDALHYTPEWSESELGTNRFRWTRIDITHVITPVDSPVDFSSTWQSNSLDGKTAYWTYCITNGQGGGLPPGFTFTNPVFGHVINNSGTNLFNTILGGNAQSISNGAAHSGIMGGLSNEVQRGSGVTVGSGIRLRARGDFAGVLSGYDNLGGDASSTIAGGELNAMGSTIDWSFIGGGRNNSNGESWDFGQAYMTTIGGRNNENEGDYATLVGGVENDIGYYAVRGFIGGGQYNFISSQYGNSESEVIVGGNRNRIYQNVCNGCGLNFIGGGEYNSSTSHLSVIGGGSYNHIKVAGSASVIGGGRTNEIYGASGIIPGGEGNRASELSFAAGKCAYAIHTGTFVWADASAGSISSTASNQAIFRAMGGFGLPIIPTNAITLADPPPGIVFTYYFTNASTTNLEERYADGTIKVYPR